MSEDNADRFAIILCAQASLDTALAQLHDSAINIRGRRQLSASTCRLTCTGNLKQAQQWLDDSRENLDRVDVWVNPLPMPAYKLLICDMDMTIVAAETLDEVADSLGLGDEIAAITKRAMHGEIDFNQALRQRIKMLAEHDESVFTDLLPELELNTGAERLLETARDLGLRTILVSGGFSQVAEAVASQLGFDEVYCNHLVLEDGKLTGEVLDPIVNAQYKRELLKRRAAELGIGLSECCAIGDGANDKPMIEAAGLGIAYFGKPILRAATTCQINHTDLNAAIYFMGLE